MEAYIEIPVNISTRALWVRALEGKLRPLHPDRFDPRYHITAVFFNDIDTMCMSEVVSKVGMTLRDMQPVSVTFGKIDIFQDGHGHHIVYLAPKDNSANPLIDKLRDVAECSRAGYRKDFKLHITLAKIDTRRIDEAELRKIISGVAMPTFTINLTTVKLIKRKPKYEVATWHLL